jgi:uncharacterized protein (DUF1778 family)
VRGGDARLTTRVGGLAVVHQAELSRGKRRRELLAQVYRQRRTPNRRTLDDMTTSPEAIRRKQARLAVRLTPAQDALIRDAAAVSGQSLTDFVTMAAVTRAEDTLADRRVFLLGDAEWAEFCAILDRPARRILELAALLNEPAPWDDGPSDSAQ